MKKVSLLLLTAFISFAIYSCKDDETPPTDNTDDTVDICDTMSVVYTGDIESILMSSCANGYCHGGGQLPWLNQYDSVVNAVNNAGLIDAISHNAGRSPMPKNGTKLSDDVIQRIKCWVEKSMPEN